MPPIRPADRAALAVYAALTVLSLGWFAFGPPVPPLWVPRAASAVYLPFRGLSAGAGQLVRLLSEYDSLRSDSARLVRARARVRELQEENERLRAQLAFGRRDTLHLIPAWVLAKRMDRLGTRVLINRGSADGVRLGYPTVSPEGLVGKVDALEAHLARVRLLTDRGSAVSARDVRSQVDGIVEGDPLEGLFLRFVSYSADVHVGDTIVTSGLGGSFPPGLPVGRVRAVGLEQGGLLRRIAIEPAAPPERVEDVFVLAAADSAAGWGFLWARPEAPTDTLAETVRAGGTAP